MPMAIPINFPSIIILVDVIICAAEKMLSVVNESSNRGQQSARLRACRTLRTEGTTAAAHSSNLTEVPSLH
jgi:hypothetical protein